MSVSPKSLIWPNILIVAIFNVLIHSAIWIWKTGLLWIGTSTQNIIKLFTHVMNANLHSPEKTLYKDTLSLCNKNVSYQCDECKSTFTQKISLQRHIEFVHQNMSYQCDKWKSTFTQKNSLQRHIESVHQNVSYQCNVINANIHSLKKIVKKDAFSLCIKILYYSVKNVIQLLQIQKKLRNLMH